MKFHPNVSRHSSNKNSEQILNSAFKFLCLVPPIEFTILTNVTNLFFFFSNSAKIVTLDATVSEC